MYFEYIYVLILINFNYKFVNKIINVNGACNFIFYLVIIYFQHKTFIWVKVSTYMYISIESLELIFIDLMYWL